MRNSSARFVEDPYEGTACGPKRLSESITGAGWRERTSRKRGTVIDAGFLELVRYGIRSAELIRCHRFID